MGHSPMENNESLPVLIWVVFLVRVHLVSVAASSPTHFFYHDRTSIYTLCLRESCLWIIRLILSGIVLGGNVLICLSGNAIGELAP